MVDTMQKSSYHAWPTVACVRIFVRGTMRLTQKAASPFEVGVTRPLYWLRKLNNCRATTLLCQLLSKQQYPFVLISVCSCIYESPRGKVIPGNSHEQGLATFAG